MRNIAYIRDMARLSVGDSEGKLHGSGEVRIDNDAEVVPATEGGAWVAAWVYISNQTLETGDT